MVIRYDKDNDRKIKDPPKVEKEKRTISLDVIKEFSKLNNWLYLGIQTGKKDYSPFREYFNVLYLTPEGNLLVATFNMDKMLTDIESSGKWIKLIKYRGE